MKEYYRLKLKISQILSLMFIRQKKQDAMPTKTARKTRRKFVQKRQRENIEDWKKNKRAGKFAKHIEEKEIDKSRSFELLKRGVMNYDNERIILAAQDEGLLTNGLKKIFKLSP